MCDFIRINKVVLDKRLKTSTCSAKIHNILLKTKLKLLHMTYVRISLIVMWFVKRVFLVLTPLSSFIVVPKKIIFDEMRCAIWYHLHNLKNVKNTHGGVLLLKCKTFPWVFFMFLKLYNWHQIAQRTTDK